MASAHPAVHRLPSIFAVVVTAALLLLAATPARVAAADEFQPGSGVVRQGPTRPPAQQPPGYDVSYPQCGTSLPEAFAFAVVGVNGGRVFSRNPCLGTGENPSELEWAGPEAQLYANTGNPGPELSKYWPDGQTTPLECNTAANPGLDTPECAYDYGWNAAADSYRTAIAAYVSLGWADPDADRTPVANFWWLDVETSNSWRSEHALNIAVLQGAVAYLESVEVGGIGFYSTPQQWGQITGGTDVFATYPAWHAGARTLRGAMANCRDVPFTGGALVMTQYFERGLDANYLCP
ncbi:MAG TPA: hypothetical protein VFX49_04775 [Chloroflexota bacterium]|nr:hypothetical protein [Chloroflexota bacterium]